MGKRENNKLPAIAMSSLQLIIAIMVLLTKATLAKGMSPRIFTFYRQSTAALVLCPIAYFSRVNKSSGSSSRIGLKAFALIFVAAFIGAVLGQNLYTEGLYLSSSSTATAITNIVPAVTFLLAAFLGMEQVDLRRLSTTAKIIGTSFSVGGAVTMALLKGPKLLNVEQFPLVNSILVRSFGEVDHTWLLGCLLVFSSSCCWSVWLILQVPLAAFCPDPLSLFAWMCFISALQAGIVAFFFERDSSAWVISSPLELTSCCYAGIMGSGVQFVIQSWCISRRGSLFSAMFSPLWTVITTVIACSVLHEEIYTGSLLGGVTVIIGLYIVLWGKADELKQKLEAEESTCKDDLEQTLLTHDTLISKKDDAN